MAVIEEDTTEDLEEMIQCGTSNYEMDIDTAVEIMTNCTSTTSGPISKLSCYPALFGPNAIPFPSAALDLANLLANPPVFTPWKFEELMLASSTSCTGPTEPSQHVEQQSSQSMDVEMDYRPYKPRRHIDWGAYDEAFAEQELRWRTIVQSHPPKNNFWSLFLRAPSHRAF